MFSKHIFCWLGEMANEDKECGNESKLWLKNGFRIPKRRVPAILHKAPSSFGAVTLGRKKHSMVSSIIFPMCASFWSFTSLELKKSLQYIETANWRLPRNAVLEMPLELRVLEAGNHDASASARGAEVVVSAGSEANASPLQALLLMEEILHQVIGSLQYPIIYRVSAPSQVVFSPDFWTINSDACSVYLERKLWSMSLLWIGKNPNLGEKIYDKTWKFTFCQSVTWRTLEDSKVVW